jgi:hypothetical protein
VGRFWRCRPGGSESGETMVGRMYLDHQVARDVVAELE